MAFYVRILRSLFLLLFPRFIFISLFSRTLNLFSFLLWSSTVLNIPLLLITCSHTANISFWIKSSASKRANNEYLSPKYLWIEMSPNYAQHQQPNSFMALFLSPSLSLVFYSQRDQHKLVGLIYYCGRSMICNEIFYYFCKFFCQQRFFSIRYIMRHLWPKLNFKLISWH